MGITADACHPPDTKVERCQFVTTIFTICETGLLQKGDNKRAETTIYVETDIVFRCQCTECDDIVLIPIWEVDRRTYELQDGCV